MIKKIDIQEFVNNQLLNEWVSNGRSLYSDSQDIFLYDR